MEDLHIYAFVVIAILISVYIVAFVSPQSSASGNHFRYAPPSGGYTDVDEIVIIQNITEKNFSSKL